MNQKDIAALVAALTPVIAAKVDEAVSIVRAKAGAVADAVAAKVYSEPHEEYQTGTAALSSRPFAGSVKTDAPILAVDLNASPLATDLAAGTDIARVIEFANALNAKVNALAEAVGHGSSAAMADHM